MSRIAIWVLAGALMFLGAGAASAANDVKNPGFEKASESNPEIPSDWWPVGTGGVLSLDDHITHDGKRSLRIEKPRPESFAGVGQNVDAASWRGKTVVLGAWLRGEGVATNSGVLWIRWDAKDRVRSEITRTSVTWKKQGEWVRGRAVLEVPDDATQLVFGSFLYSTGKLWMDSVELLDLASIAIVAPSATVVAYIDEAIGKIKAHALRAGRVDWQQARSRAVAMALDGTEASDAHASVGYLLRQLGDHHSHLRPPEEAAALKERGDTNFGIESRQIGRIGYISVPGYAGNQVDREKAFALDVRDRVAIQAPNSCGWIVDLRKNIGGNMYPMIGGLAPFLGDADLGYFIAPSYRDAWSLAWFHERTGLSVPESLVALRDAPVAVLIGPRTSSSGEATLISFIGRPNTRTFGSATSGLSTANSGYPLSDGALMLITTSVMADRTGREYGEAIKPDVAVLESKEAGVDSALDAARAWLEGQPACKPPRSSPTA